MYGDNTYLIKALEAGDEQAYKYVYQEHRKWMSVAALQIVRDEAVAQDMVQELFTDFFSRNIFGRLQPPYDLKRYLFQAIQNKCRDYIRRGHVWHSRHHKYIQEVNLEQQSILRDLEQRDREMEITQAIDAAIKQLPAQTATAFKLSYIDHKTRSEVAKEMGKSPHTIKNLIARALMILRKELKILHP